jgi:hypothetical protein
MHQRSRACRLFLEWVPELQPTTIPEGLTSRLGSDIISYDDLDPDHTTTTNDIY